MGLFKKFFKKEDLINPTADEKAFQNLIKWTDDNPDEAAKIDEMTKRLRELYPEEFVEHRNPDFNSSEYIDPFPALTKAVNDPNCPEDVKAYAQKTIFDYNDMIQRLTVELKNEGLL